MRCGSALLPPALPVEARSTGMAYLLWALCVFCVAGVHRFYLGKYFTGLLWLFTWGLLGVGLLIDLLLIPGMVERANERRARDAPH